MDTILNKEIWKPVVGFEGYYEVSNSGKVRSLPRKSTWFNPRFGVYVESSYKGKILNQKETIGGYLQVTLNIPGKILHTFVHRLVGMAFVDGYKEGYDINHKDENPKNNRFDNLEWCSRQYNNNYGNRLKRVAKSLSKGYLQYDTEGNLIAEFDTAKQAQESTGIYYTSIKACCVGRYHTAGGYIWRHRNEPLHNNIRS